MQASKFSNGSYVAHDVRVNSDVSPMRFSVWFSAEGELTDCEAFYKNNRTRAVSPKVRKVLATMFGWVVHASRSQA